MGSARSEQQETELKPCPFCGAAGHIQDSEGGGMYVHCMGRNCLCALGEHYDRDAMDDHWFHDKEQAAIAWNTRPAAPAQDQGGTK